MDNVIENYMFSLNIASCSFKNYVYLNRLITYNLIKKAAFNSIENDYE